MGPILIFIYGFRKDAVEAVADVRFGEGEGEYHLGLRRLFGVQSFILVVATEDDEVQGSTGASFGESRFRKDNGFSGDDAGDDPAIDPGLRVFQFTAR